MSAQYRDNLNNPYQRTLYSTARARENCVSCPSSCSCDLGQRSNMDRLMIQAWQQGPEGHTAVFDTLNTNHHKPNHSMHHHEKYGHHMHGSHMMGGDMDDHSMHHHEKYGHHMQVTDQDKLSQKYCPHMPPHDGKYVQTTQSHRLKYMGKHYDFKTCCPQCAKAVKEHPYKYVVKCPDHPSKLCLKHRNTGDIVQYLKNA